MKTVLRAKLIILMACLLLSQLASAQGGETEETGEGSAVKSSILSASPPGGVPPVAETAPISPRKSTDESKREFAEGLMRSGPLAKGDAFTAAGGNGAKPKAPKVTMKKLFQAFNDAIIAADAQVQEEGLMARTDSIKKKAVRRYSYQGIPMDGKQLSAPDPLNTVTKVVSDRPALQAH